MPRYKVVTQTMLAYAAVALAACAASDATETVCTRGDVDSPCSQATAATQLDPNYWRVILRTTVTDTVEYIEDGQHCAYLSRTCHVSVCEVYVDEIPGADPATFTSGDAIAACID
jgi:hypothetical protein